MVVDKEKIIMEMKESLEKFQCKGQSAVDDNNAEILSPVCVKEQTMDPMTTSIILDPGEDLPGSVTTSAKHSISQEDSVITTLQDKCSTAHAVAKTTEFVSTVISTKVTSSEKKVRSTKSNKPQLTI